MPSFSLNQSITYTLSFLVCICTMQLVGCASTKESNSRPYSEQFLNSSFFKGASIFEEQQDCSNAVDYFESGIKKREYFELSTLYYDYCVGTTGTIEFYTRSSIYVGAKRGKGITADELYWIGKGVKIGGVVEQFAAGQMYLNGYVLEKNQEQALLFLTLAAKGGHSHAQMQLALTLIELGEIDNAILWLEQATKNGYPGAEGMLTTMNAIYKK